MSLKTGECFSPVFLDGERRYTLLFWGAAHIPRFADVYYFRLSYLDRKQYAVLKKLAA